MRRWEENGSRSQSVLGSNPVSAWETLTEPPGISEPQSLLRRGTIPPSQPSVPTVGSCTTVCGCPASEKPGGTRHRKCLASSRLCGCSLNASPRRELPMDLENFHLEKGGRLESPTSLPQSSGTQAERGDPSESLPGLLGAGGERRGTVGFDR